MASSLLAPQVDDLGLGTLGPLLGVARRIGQARRIGATTLAVPGPLEKLLDGVEDRSGRGGTLRRLLRQRAQAQLLQLLGDATVGGPLTRRDGLLRHHLDDGGQGRSLPEGGAAREDLVQQRAQRVDIRMGPHPIVVPLRLLRWHVGGSPHHRAMGGHGLLRRNQTLLRTEFLPAGQNARHAPIHDMHLAVGAHHQVLRLEISVHDAPAVGVVNPHAHLLKEGQQPHPGELGGHRLVALLQTVQHVRQRAPSHPLHGEEDLARLQVAQVVHRHHVGVFQLGGDSSLLQKARLQIPVAGVQELLDRHLSAEELIPGLPHHAHAPAPDLLGPHVPTLRGNGQLAHVAADGLTLQRVDKGGRRWSAVDHRVPGALVRHDEAFDRHLLIGPGMSQDRPG